MKKRMARAAVYAAAILLPLSACGKKGAPLEPLRLVPAPPTEASVRRVGADVRLQFTLPIANANGPGTADIAAVEIYAITVAPGTVRPPDREILIKKHIIATLPVKPAPSDEETTAPEQPTPAPPPDDRPGPGERVTFNEQLTASTLVPTFMPKQGPEPRRAADADAAAGGPLPPPDPPMTTRIYAVRGISRRGHPGPSSRRLSLPLVPPPPAPTELTATVTETALALAWTSPPMVADPTAESVAVHAATAADEWIAASLPGQARGKGSKTSDKPAGGPPEWVPLRALPGAPLPVSVAMPVHFNVYEVIDGQPAPLPLNPAPIATAVFPLGAPEWERQRCFVVRSVRKYGFVTIEGDDVGPQCVTPRDTYPPAAPAGLRVVASTGVMNLIWNPNTETDLAGYLVLRGEAPGDALQPITPAPIRETTYQDTTAKPGVRYFYAIVAVDKATPPNTSPQSPKQEEIAR